MVMDAGKDMVMNGGKGATMATPKSTVTTTAHERYTVTVHVEEATPARGITQVTSHAISISTTISVTGGVDTMNVSW